MLICNLSLFLFCHKFGNVNFKKSKKIENDAYIFNSLI